MHSFTSCSESELCISSRTTRRHNVKRGYNLTSEKLGPIFIPLGPSWDVKYISIKPHTLKVASRIKCPLEILNCLLALVFYHHSAL
jgi:hypothetical protein